MPPDDVDATAGVIPRDAGWSGSFQRFADTEAKAVFDSLRGFVANPGVLQEGAWKECIPALQREVREVLAAESRASDYSLLMEYLIPLELRRSDVVLLVADGVLVVEFKTKRVASTADLDQAAAYARDLRAYHRECENLRVEAVVVPMTSAGQPSLSNGVWTCPPAALDDLVVRLSGGHGARIMTLGEFLRADAFQPLPTLVQAARELFNSGRIRTVWRAHASTEPATQYIARVAHQAAASSTRHLVLITGTPGAGKTLVGMRAVHAHYLDDLARDRGSGRPTSPALFLSGNQPLVEVLQYVLRDAGGAGKAFVRHIKGYLNSFAPRPDRIPPQNLLVFDEAQRAFTPDKVRSVHEEWSEDLVRSEPELFVRICERMPNWSVLVGLIGSGQHIYLGEEGGLEQWRTALEHSSNPDQWHVHAPADVEAVFAGSRIRTTWAPELHLDTQLRFHTASHWHHVVEALLGSQGVEPERVKESLSTVYSQGQESFRVWLTRDLQSAKRYLRERYDEQPEARFGMIASSRDTLLKQFNVPNLFPDYSRIRVGKWFAGGDEVVESCRHLTTCVTEFQSQGLELDMALLAWGSDLVRQGGQWDTSNSRKFAKGSVGVRDAFGLRLNSYRVLLTRGRDGTIVFLPPHKLLDETWAYLRACGFAELPVQLEPVG